MSIFVMCNGCNREIFADEMICPYCKVPAYVPKEQGRLAGEALTEVKVVKIKCEFCDNDARYVDEDANLTCAICPLKRRKRSTRVSDLPPNTDLIEHAKTLKNA